MKVLYIAGAGRSGSTLVARLLGEVRGFVNVGEATAHLLSRERRSAPIPCGCGHRMELCEFWGPLLPQIHEEGCLGARYQRLRALPGLLSSLRAEPIGAELEAYRRACASLLLGAGAAAGPDADVVVDSSKVPANALVMADSPEIDLYVVHLVRDCRGFINSRSSDKAYLRRMSPFRAAAVWMGKNLATETLSRRVDNYRLVRYEDFVAKPESYVDRIVRYVTGGARPLDFMDGSTAQVGMQHIVAGNPDKLSDGELIIRPPDRTNLNFAARVASIPALPLNSRYRRSKFFLPKGA